MKYIRVDADTFIEYDKTTKQSRIISKSGIEAELALTQTQLDSLHPSPSNAELLAWAKSNFDDSDFRAREVLEGVIKTLGNKLEKINEIP